jgi:hypothetical protein
MKRPTNVHKFKIAATLVGFLVVAVIGYTLWFVNHSEKVANDAYAKSGNSYTVKPVKKTPANTTQTQKYLTIKEWGVQIPLTPDENDLTYVAKTEEGTTSYHILSPSIAKLCGPGWDGSLGILGRSVSDPAKQGSYQSQVKVGAYFYTMGVIQNPCSQDDVIDKREISASITLNKQFKLLQAAPQQYLTVKEWGVKAPINTDLSLVYDIQDNSASFTSSQLRNASSMCVNYGGKIARVKPNDNYMEDGTGQTAAMYAARLDKLYSSKQYALVNGYYYFFQHDQGGCSNDDHVLSLQTQTNDAVKALVPTIVAQ